jgi:hypothetical protein
MLSVLMILSPAVAVWHNKKNEKYIDNNDVSVQVDIDSICRAGSGRYSQRLQPQALDVSRLDPLRRPLSINKKYQVYCVRACFIIIEFVAGVDLVHHLQ